MKKTLLAAALLAGFAGVAQAETSVTLYGIIDTGIGYNKISGAKDGNAAKIENGSRFGMINGVQNGSRWGLRGSEDLGDGLRAVFTLESGFDSGNGKSGQSSRLFGRQATIGLASDSWGQLDFGRQTNIASKYFGSIDPFGAGFGQANIGTAFSAANKQRYDNMVMYQTPSFSGFQFGIGYSFNADDTKDAQTGFRTADNTRAITTGLRYVNGPLNVAFSYDQLNRSNALKSGPGADDTTRASTSWAARMTSKWSSWLWLSVAPRTAGSLAGRERELDAERQLRQGLHQHLPQGLQGQLVPGRSVGSDRWRQQRVRFVANG